MSSSLTKVVSPLMRSIPQNLTLRAMYSGKDGEAGSIRAGGGSFAKREAAQEDQYFRKLQQEQLKNLKGHLEEEISHHEAEVKRHQQRIKQLKEKTQTLDSSK